MKLNKTESAALVSCKHLRTMEPGEERNLSIIWVKSRTWGMNPHVMYGRHIVGKASGYGYNKESAALADFLHFLPESEDDQRAIWTTSGCGVNSVISALGKIGWELVKTYEGKAEDGYTLRKA